MKPWVHRLTATVAIAFWIYVALVALGSGEQTTRFLLLIAEFALAGTAGVIAAVTLHELGHVLFGLLAGLRFHHLTIAGLKLRSTEKGFRLEKAPEARGAEASMVARSLNRLRERMIVCSAGGFGGSIATLLIGWQGVARHPSMARSIDRLSTEFFFTMAVTAACHLFWALDLRPRSTPNDGLNIRGMVRGDVIGRQKIASQALYVAASSKQEETFLNVLRDYGQGIDVSFLGGYLRFLTSEGWLLARSEVERMVQGDPPSVQSRAKLAFTYAVDRVDLDRARELVPSAEETPEEARMDRLYALTVIAYSEENWSRVLDYVEEARLLAAPGEAPSWFVRRKSEAETKLVQSRIDESESTTLPIT